MKKITNADIIRKIDFSETAKPAYVETFKTVNDQGFKNFLSSVISKDETRRQKFVDEQKKISS